MRAATLAARRDRGRRRASRSRPPCVDGVVGEPGERVAHRHAADRRLVERARVLEGALHVRVVGAPHDLIGVAVAHRCSASKRARKLAPMNTFSARYSLGRRGVCSLNPACGSSRGRWSRVVDRAGPPVARLLREHELELGVPLEHAAEDHEVHGAARRPAAALEREQRDRLGAASSSTGHPRPRDWSAASRVPRTPTRTAPRPGRCMAGGSVAAPGS